MHDTTQDWQYLAQNFTDISAKVITDKALLGLSIYILAMEYLEEEDHHFIKIIVNNKESNEEAEMVFDSENEIK